MSLPILSLSAEKRLVVRAEEENQPRLKVPIVVFFCLARAETVSLPIPPTDTHTHTLSLSHTHTHTHTHTLSLSLSLSRSFSLSLSLSLPLSLSHSLTHSLTSSLTHPLNDSLCVKHEHRHTPEQYAAATPAQTFPSETPTFSLHENVLPIPTPLSARLGLAFAAHILKSERHRQFIC